MTDLHPTNGTPSGLLVALLLMLAVCPAARAIDSAEVKRLFADPPREYSSGPLWVWNDLLTDEQIVQTMRDLAGEGVRQVFVHPRPGLMTPYLEDDWFRLWRVALDEAEKLDMNVWIYDENSYPSGFAGGLVPEAMPESRGRGLLLRPASKPPKSAEGCLALYRVDGDTCEDVTAKLQAGEAMPEGTYLTATIQRAGRQAWHGGWFYTDLLYPEVTRTFLSLTLDPYRRKLGDQIGKRIPGVFTDEPNIRPAGGFPWTDDLPVQFERRWGYSLMDHLPSLAQPIGDWKRVRHNYLQTLLDLFVERWGRPYYEYCEKYGLEFTGHYWEHDWPHCLGVPDNMAMYAWHQRPAIDNLMNEYSEGPHAQFGNLRTVKELSSVANQLGRARTLCETYGAGGWDLRFEDMKRIADWLYVLGVNTLNEHLSYITIRGARKRDHPQSFSYHTPWWDSYDAMAGYVTRLSAALSSGQEINPVLILEPTTTAWMYHTEAQNEVRLTEIGNVFQKLVTDLSKAQVEYDIGCEDILARNGSVAGRELVIGKRRYATVVLPPLTENVNAQTASLLEKYVAAGGTVLCCGEPPTRVDGQSSDWGPRVTAQANWKRIEVDALVGLLQAVVTDGFAVMPAAGKSTLLFHHRRQLDDGDIVCLVNTDIEKPAAGSVKSRAGSVEQWDLMTGTIRPYPFKTASDGGIELSFDLEPAGSLLLFLGKERAASPPKRSNASTAIAMTPPSLRRVEPNVLVLDFVDASAGGETVKDTYVLRAAAMAFKQNGLDRNPWDSAVQFRDQLISKTFPADSGFEAIYRFTIRDRVPASLFAVIERPDLYTVHCNGKPVEAAKDAWWLDRAFGRIDIAAAAQVGANELRIKASPFTLWHELEAAYVLGDFTLEPAEKGFVVAPASELKLGAWNAQGHPFYSAGVAYTQECSIAEPSGRYVVSMPDWYGSVAKVAVNGEPAGVIFCSPWECDVTAAIKPGTNRIEVTVVGTLKNTLGPHHGNPPLGRAWPGMFHQAPETGPPAGGQYSTVGYGLNKPFVLKHMAQ